MGSTTYGRSWGTSAFAGGQGFQPRYVYRRRRFQQIEANIAFIEHDRMDEAVWTLLEGRRRRLKIMEQFCKGCGKCLEYSGNQA